MTEHTALLIIDMQKENGLPLERLPQVVDNASTLIAAARSQGIPLFYTRHVNDALGRDMAPGEPADTQGRPLSYQAGSASVEILDALAPHPDDCVIDKQRYSAFHGTRLAALLRSRGIRRLVVLGMLTDVCVMTSLFDAYQHDFELVLVADACTATTLAAHYSSLLILSNWVYGLEIFSTQQLIKHWRGEPAQSLRTSEPDHLAYQPQAFVEAIHSFERRLAREC